MKRNANLLADHLPKKSKCPENEINVNKESSALHQIIGNTSIDSFLSDVYQKEPHLFHTQIHDKDSRSAALTSVYSMGWDGVCSMLHKSHDNLYQYHSVESNQEDFDTSSLPLFFRNQTPIQSEEIRDTYGNSPFAAYLDGCSIVNNHADLLSAPLAALCLDLQQSFPHAYVNTYLTPPSAAAVSAHADDRDVFVIQVMGEKNWKVYADCPIPYPSHHEQVGKKGLPVPATILEKNPLFDITLKPGDVLYMPRGYVHEAATSVSEPSFHCTVAIATADWSLSTTVTEIVKQQLESHTNFRMAVHPQFGMRSSNDIDSKQKDDLSILLKDAVERISSTITVESVAQSLGFKYKTHNEYVQSKRERLIVNEIDASDSLDSNPSSAIVGPAAARRVKMTTKIRASTDQEKESAPPPVATHGRGLTVREETCDTLLMILSILRKVGTSIQVSELLNSLPAANEEAQMVCELTILSFVKCCVGLGAIALA